MGSKRAQNDAKTMPKSSQSDPKVTPVQPTNGPKSPQNHPKNGPTLVPKWPYIASDRVKNGSKRGQNGRENGKKKTVQKSSRPSSLSLGDVAAERQSIFFSDAFF